MPKARAISRLPIGVVLSLMNASSSSRLGTRPLAIGSGAGRRYVGLGLLLGRGLLLGGGLLGRLVPAFIGGGGPRLLGPRGPGRLARPLGSAFGETRHRRVD